MVHPDPSGKLSFSVGSCRIFFRMLLLGGGNHGKPRQVPTTCGDVDIFGAEPTEQSVFVVASSSTHGKGWAKPINHMIHQGYLAPGVPEVKDMSIG